MKVPTRGEVVMRILLAVAVVLSLGSVVSADNQYTSARLAPLTYGISVWCLATNVSGSSVTATLSVRDGNGNLLGGGGSTTIAAGVTRTVLATVQAGGIARCEVITSAAASAIRLAMQGLTSADFATEFEGEGR